MERQIDPTSPVPLYYQIAEAIRARIEAGALAPGDTLTPLREAAEAWGVNLHTVRHAYAALAREGLVAVHRGAKGTEVLSQPLLRRTPTPDLEAFLVRMTREAQAAFGLTPAGLAEALKAHDNEDTHRIPVVYVVECSAWQCEAHARELRAQWAVDARIWPLTRDGEPPDGPVVSTYFHYNDIRCRWPQRLSSVHFITIHPDPALKARLASRASRLLVCERDEATAQAVTADLVALFDDPSLAFETVIEAAPSLRLFDANNTAPILFSPRVWADLPDAVRTHPRAIELRYVFEPGELERLGKKMGWPHRITTKEATP